MVPKRQNRSGEYATPGKRAQETSCLILVCLALLVGGCSVAPSSDDIGQDDQLPQATDPQVTEVTESTEITDATEVTETTEATSLAPGLPDGRTTPTPEAAIRFEGDEEVRFSGICSVGDTRSVLTGVVPERFEFRLDGFPLDCNIENQSGGTLRAVLVADGDTRSVQQTSGSGGIISVSYDG